MKCGITIKPGDKFNRLTVLGEPFKAVLYGGHSRTCVVAQCQCGTIRVYDVSTVRKSKGCGCGKLVEDFPKTIVNQDTVSINVRGKSVLVDNDTYEQISKWSIHVDYRDYVYIVSKGKRFALHRFVLGISSTLDFADHIDGNRLNNIRSNLRECDVHQNAMNVKSRKSTSSIYKGVSWNNARKYWVASIKVNGKTQYLGRFNTEIAAAQAFDQASRKIFGEFGRCNFPIGNERSAIVEENER